MQSLLNYFADPLKSILAALSTRLTHPLQEIRIREGRPLEASWGGGYGFISGEGAWSRSPEGAYRPTRQDCAALLELLTQHSMYTFEEELKRGFLTIQGGHRVGLAGRTVIEQGKVKYIKEVSGFNIRIAREWKQAGKAVLPHLLDPRHGNLLRTLVVSPPQLGKTTLIRDLARLLSGGDEAAGRRAFKVGIVDERSEIAAAVRGVPGFDLGPRTDVLDGCPKAEGMMMMIRSMSPEVLVADEIGRAEDAAALHEALHAGISVIATAHGRDVEDIRRRPILKELLQDGVFERFVVLSPAGQAACGGLAACGPQTAVFDGSGRRLDERLALRGGASL
ncbi:stage III sporulation protein AA [Paenibacillus sp. UNCCL117]|uniref:stage III sporulation protein AA n=1 Tax=unclassified Paenibacillus TaxID=185978 RepID=UPI0008919121|nr:MULTISPECIES: stage III sporulation protein AA [unclassified Paenibacillus]SDD43826.1 stage III sporulation protein AA [Paenibacillus sp. cl123]SFW47275.1 stage III sporulation protein AA [Paenibacillus sp. UNCCL117]